MKPKAESERKRWHFGGSSSFVLSCNILTISLLKNPSGGTASSLQKQVMEFASFYQAKVEVLLTSFMEI